MVCELDLGSHHFDIEQAFVQSDVGKNVFVQACRRNEGECRGRS